MGDLLLSAEQFFCWVVYPWSVMIPGVVLFSRLYICARNPICVRKSHLCLAMESLSITELVLVKHEQELISGSFVSQTQKLN